MIANLETLGDPLARLEIGLINEFLSQHGLTRKMLRQLPSLQSDHLMHEAVRYASARLAEMESRARFIRVIHNRA